MKTIVEIRKGRDFSANNLGYADFEPAVVFPKPEFLLGGFRLKVNQSVTTLNKSGGTTGSSASAPNAQYFSDSVTVPTGEAFALPGTLNRPATLISVFYHEASQPSTTLGGSPNTGTTSFGMIATASGTSAWCRSSGTNHQAALARAAGGARWEFVASTFDYDAGMRIYRPRDNASASNTTVGIVPSGSGATPRYLGNTVSTYVGAVRGAFSAVYSGVALTESEIQELYESVKESLAVSGINI